MQTFGGVVERAAGIDFAKVRRMGTREQWAALLEEKKKQDKITEEEATKQAKVWSARTSFVVVTQWWSGTATFYKPFMYLLLSKDSWRVPCEACSRKHPLFALCVHVWLDCFYRVRVVPRRRS